MKEKKNKVGVLIILLVIAFTSSAYAYSLKSTKPTSTSLYYYNHSTIADYKSAVNNARSAWNNVSNGIHFIDGGDSTGAVNLDDSRSDICINNFNYIWYLGVSNDANGVCFTNNYSDYDVFDIYLNSNKDWSYIDRQGILTHEFGHAAGLYENYTIPNNASPDDADPALFQTMYPYCPDLVGNNISSYLRTLESDDISGVQYVASEID